MLSERRMRGGVMVVALLALVMVGCPRPSTTPVVDTPSPSDGPGAEGAPEWGTPASAGADAAAGEEKLAGEGFAEPELVQQGMDEAVQSLDEEVAEARQVLQPVFFAFDSSSLSDVSLRTIEANVRWLTLHPDLRVVVEGHCDERGTIEYNLELGARRARAIREHMIRLGLDAARIETLSYGEERPADPGHDEAAWARNRRAEFRAEPLR
ncbi:MAG: OmpA family protein [Acidobacteriota bacterium]|nr:OmpA family protein [Acidobacteriota bacterium]